jgi:serine/threonine protein kinase
MSRPLSEPAPGVATGPVTFLAPAVAVGGTREQWGVAPIVMPRGGDDGGPDRFFPGMRIGPYEITGFLGAGGMGEVYRAHDTNLDRIVALKLLPVGLAADPERVRRFEEEARAASALSHPALVTIYDAGQIGNRAFISMELVAGETLRDILRLGPLPIRRALRIGTQLAEGLANAHDAGLIHRDLKPENIKVSEEGFAKILDFGLAKRVGPGLIGELGATRTGFETSPGTVVGTAGYMSPEQASGGRADCASDQFSFGAILYEMLTGHRAFDRPTMAETISAVIREEPVPIAHLNPSIPPPVRWIVERCLAKDPTERYTFTRDLARDLGSARDHLAELLGRRVRRAHRTAAEKSLAVLPVLDLSVPAQPEALADTMTDALITALTQDPTLRVISRMSSLNCKGRRVELAEMAEELGVGWIVLSSIAKAGREIRITAQLVDARSDENRWAGSYIRDGRRILTLQSEVAAAIAAAVAAAVSSAR